MALGPGWKAVPESAVVLSQWQVGQVARNWRFNLRDLKLGKKIKKNFCFAYFLPHIDNYEIFLSFHRKNTLRKFLDSCLGIIFFFFFNISVHLLRKIEVLTHESNSVLKYTHASPNRTPIHSEATFGYWNTFGKWKLTDKGSRGQENNSFLTSKYWLMF